MPRDGRRRGTVGLLAHHQDLIDEAALDEVLSVLALHRAELLRALFEPGERLLRSSARDASCPLIPDHLYPSPSRGRAGRYIGAPSGRPGRARFALLRPLDPERRPHEFDLRRDDPQRNGTGTSSRPPLPMPRT